MWSYPPFMIYMFQLFLFYMAWMVKRPKKGHTCLTLLIAPPDAFQELQYPSRSAEINFWFTGHRTE